MNKLFSIQFLRAFACISVLITHVLQVLKLKPFGDYYVSGGYGVDLFFIISGFLIYITTKETDSWRAFAIKRVFRIFPLYWFAFFSYLIFYILHDDIDISIEFLIQNFFMMVWNKSVLSHSLLVGVAWSTVYEVYFYIIFTVLLLFKINKKYIIALLLSLLVFMKIVYYINPLNCLEYGFFNYIYSIVGTTFIIPFIIGIMIGMVYKKQIIKDVILNNKNFFKLFFGVAIAIYFFVLITQYNQFKSYVLSTLIFSLFLMVDYIYTINYETTMVKLSIVVGDISYSIYLLHCIIIEVLITCLRVENFLLLLLLSIITTLPISYLTYNYIEKPFINKSKFLIKHYNF